MSGESFSTLQMQNIMSSLQHQLGSPQTMSSVDLASGDPVSTDITQNLSQEIGEDSKSHIAHSTNVSHPNAQDDCTVHPQDAEPVQNVHNPEQHRSVESIIGSAVNEVSMKRDYNLPVIAFVLLMYYHVIKGLLNINVYHK